MREFLYVAKRLDVNCGNKLISRSLLFIRNEKFVNELGEVVNSRYEGTLYLNAAQSSTVFYKFLQDWGIFNYIKQD